MNRIDLKGATTGLTIAAAALVTLGSVGPWLTSELPGVGKGGLEGDGPVLLALTAVAMTVVMLHAIRGLRRRWLVVPAVAGVLMTVTTFADRADVDDRGLSTIVDLGWGLQLATIGAVAFTVAVLALAATAGRSRAVAATPVSR